MAKSTGGAKKVDRRVLRTRKAIMNAFDKLVSMGGVDKITVSAIAREADIDRKTFYLHYKSIDDLANYRTEQTLERVLDALKEAGNGKTFLERVHIMLAEVNMILTTNISVYENIASGLSTDQVLGYFEKAAEPALEHVGLDPELAGDQQVRMQLQFFIAGACSLYSTWLKSDRKQPIETVSNAIETAFTALRASNPPLEQVSFA